MANVLFVTSGKGGVGKSTVASALGLTYAANGSRTVIIELDIGLRGLDLMSSPSRRMVLYPLLSRLLGFLPALITTTLLRLSKRFPGTLKRSLWMLPPVLAFRF